MVGKSDIKSDTFDVLIFARRDIEHAVYKAYFSFLRFILAQSLKQSLFQMTLNYFQLENVHSLTQT